MNAYDIAAARAERIGNRIGMLEARGGCAHGHLQTDKGAGDWLDRPATCKRCGERFATTREAMAAHGRIARGGE